MTRIPNALRRQVYDRAEGRCEYCLLQELYSIKRHHIDHITAQKHGGGTEENNLCLSCASCNSYKGTDLTGIDPTTNEIVHLFHPRQDLWENHFRLEDARIEGLTPQGRATVRVLQLNNHDNLDERARLIELGFYP